MIRLGILGCGAITRAQHLPAALAHPGVQLAALVDADLERAKALRQLYGLNCQVSSEWRDIVGRVDAVINALPNHLHVPASVEFLQAGVHVLCEKPLANTVTGAWACCEASEEKGVVLAVGMPRRFYESTRLMHLVLEQRLLGSLLSYEWDYGVPFEWGTASGFYFSRAQAGGGVLLNEGIHLLDCLLDWFGPVTSFEYQDDNWGSGIEANAVLALQHSGCCGDLSGRVRLSRTYSLKNRLVVRGTQARAEIPRSDPDSLVLYRIVAGQEVSMTLGLPEARGGVAGSAFARQLNNFVEAVRGEGKPAVSGRQALEAIELIERCYAQAKRIPEPWSENCETSHEAGSDELAEETHIR